MGAESLRPSTRLIAHGDDAPRPALPPAPSSSHSHTRTHARAVILTLSLVCALAAWALVSWRWGVALLMLYLAAVFSILAVLAWVKNKCARAPAVLA